MELNKAKMLKGVGTAVVLTGMMVVSVMVNPQNTADKPRVEITDAEDRAFYQPRVYTSHDKVASRAAQPSKPKEDFTYTVQQGDTLYDLALTYGVTVEAIAAANGLESDKLSLEQRLLIPASGKVTIKPVPAKKKVVPKAGSGNAQQSVSRSRFSGRAVGEKIAWSSVQDIFARGEVATLIDVDTGYSFKIKRKGGSNHADCEPLTAADTAIMKKLYGGSWSWERRAVVALVDGKRIAASMAGMPHGSKSINGNNFGGHFDLHFLGSMTHGSEYTASKKPMVEPAHQAMVRKAAGQ